MRWLSRQGDAGKAIGVNVGEADRTSLAITLSDKLCRLAGVACLELASRHDDGVEIHRLEGQCDLKGLTLTFTTPNSQNQGNLDLLQGLVHQILSTVHSELHKMQPGEHSCCCCAA